ncbi:MAG: hypothetical protein U1E29_10540, partial [Coriobacteriia bacterium]|nr:hypothetical protein [Coriobacteriia bacterium]
MAVLETDLYSIPDFGPVIERSSLKKVFFSQSYRLTVICAPPGYGKSVLASQLAAKESFDRVLWVSLYDRDVRNDDWLRDLARALDPSSRGGAAYAPSAVPAAFVSRADALLRIREGLRGHEGRTFCLVLDGCNRVESLHAFEEVAGLLCGYCGPASCLVVTCRSIADSGHIPDPSRTWAVDEHDLRFGTDDIRKLMAVMGDAGDAPSEADGILERFCGHPALTSLVLRHGRLDDRIDPPQDLVWHTRRLVSQLPDEILGVLYVAAMLKEGTAREVGECLAGGSFRADWAGAQSASPLLTIMRDEDSEPLAFRMHAVLCDALVRVVPHRLGVEEAAGLRNRTLMILSQAGDYVRLHAVLTSTCSAEEIAGWCESRGSELMHHAGAAAVDRCLGRIPPARVADSTRLLLLRATILREQERWDEAFTHAA